MGIILRPGDTNCYRQDLGPRPVHLLKCLGDWQVSVQIAGHERVMPSTKERRDRLAALKANTPIGRRSADGAGQSTSIRLRNRPELSAAYGRLKG